MSENESNQARRSVCVVVFGATGHLGQALIAKLAESDWPIASLLGVASSESAGETFEFRGEELDLHSEWPVLRGQDLVFLCTPPTEALEIIREALRAEVPCIDCTGALANQADVPLPPPPSVGGTSSDDDRIGQAPILSVLSGTTLAWAPILDALGVSRASGTVVSSAAALGRKGVVALSEESIALFNQSEDPGGGPAGQPVAFDVIPGGGIDCERVRSECQRLFGDRLRLDLANLQVPTFVGEGTSLFLELTAPLRLTEIETRLNKAEGLTVVREGPGSRGLAEVSAASSAPIGPTLRDAIGSDQILIGRIEPDQSLPEGLGWRCWLTCDPLRLTADQAFALASRRLGLT